MLSGLVIQSVQFLFYFQAVEMINIKLKELEQLKTVKIFSIVRLTSQVSPENLYFLSQSQHLNIYIYRLSHRKVIYFPKTPDVSEDNVSRPNRWNIRQQNWHNIWMKLLIA